MFTERGEFFDATTVSCSLASQSLHLHLPLPCIVHVKTCEELNARGRTQWHSRLSGRTERLSGMFRKNFLPVYKQQIRVSGHEVRHAPCSERGHARFLRKVRHCPRFVVTGPRANRWSPRACPGITITPKGN